VHSLLIDVAGVARDNHAWMTWNLALAAVPAALAVGLFARPGRRGVWWWAGVVVFVAFLPNAPYLVTDLVHLRGDVVQAPSNGVVLVGVLPLYAAFVAAGFAAYAVALAGVGTELTRRGLGHLRVLVVAGLHGLCAVGIVLGRVARLNSWEPFTEPVGSLERSLDTLSWRLTPFVVVVLAVVLAVGHVLTVAVAGSAWRWVRRAVGGSPASPVVG